MPDNLGQKLRDGAEQFAGEITPAAPHAVRARGDQRRRRRLAGSVALAAVIVAGGGAGAAYALGQPGHYTGPPAPPATSGPPSPRVTHPHATTRATNAPAHSPSDRPASIGPASGVTGTASPGGDTVTLRLGHLVLHAPQGWRVTYRDAQGDYTVSTGTCAGSALIGGAGGSPCPSFSLIAGITKPAGPAPGTHDYEPGEPYVITTGGVACPGKPNYGVPAWFRGQGPELLFTGDEPVTSTRTADYDVWQYSCLQLDNGVTTQSFDFQQRDWYLPQSGILIVDEYSIPGLAHVLATATWR